MKRPRRSARVAVSGRFNSGPAAFAGPRQTQTQSQQPQTAPTDPTQPPPSPQPQACHTKNPPQQTTSAGPAAAVFVEDQTPKGVKPGSEKDVNSVGIGVWERA